MATYQQHRYPEAGAQYEKYRGLVTRLEGHLDTIDAELGLIEYTKKPSGHPVSQNGVLKGNYYTKQFAKQYQKTGELAFDLANKLLTFRNSLELAIVSVIAKRDLYYSQKDIVDTVEVPDA